MLLVIVGALAWKVLRTNNNDSATRRPTTTIELLEKKLHLGTFNISEVRNGRFRIRNSGEKPLIILDAAASCNCTTLLWPRKPVSPGDTAVIQVTYTASERGRFAKTIDLYCNTSPSLTTLHIDGYIE